VTTIYSHYMPLVELLHLSDFLLHIVYDAGYAVAAIPKPAPGETKKKSDDGAKLPMLRL
jgi:hypothetical protein